MNKMKLFDSHCHLQDPRIGEDLHSVMNRASVAGVSAMLCCGTSEQDWDKVIEISQKYESVIPALGIHPWFIGTRSEKWLDRLECVLKSFPEAAVGEIGLDYTLKGGNEKEQLSVFIDQLRLAAKLDRPLSIHCRKAWGDLTELLEQEKGVSQGGAIHSYSGAPQLVSRIQSFGLSISFSGSLTREGNRRGKASLVHVDPERLLIETDSPDLLPRGHTGNNEPANIISIVKEVSSVLGYSDEMVSEITFNNGMELFKR